MPTKQVVIIGTMTYQEDAVTPPQPPSGAHPEHPIYYPPHIWGGGNQPFPTPPIANVPGIDNPNPPGWGQKPPNIWGGSNEPFPTPPIANVPGIGNPNPPGFGLKPAHPIELPPPVDPPEGYHWEQIYQPPGWRWTMVPTEGKGMNKGPALPDAPE